MLNRFYPPSRITLVRSPVGHSPWTERFGPCVAQRRDPGQRSAPGRKHHSRCLPSAGICRGGVGHPAFPHAGRAPGRRAAVAGRPPGPQGMAGAPAQVQLRPSVALMSHAVLKATPPTRLHSHAVALHPGGAAQRAAGRRHAAPAARLARNGARPTLWRPLLPPARAARRARNDAPLPHSPASLHLRPAPSAHLRTAYGTLCSSTQTPSPHHARRPRS